MTLMTAHHVIYVPGLGDHRTKTQRLAPQYWQVFGVKGHCFLMQWRDQEPFASKLERLLSKIDELAADGHKVSLVGASAGASVVLVAYAARLDKVSGVVCICGKINHPETVGPERFLENPAFKDSLARLQEVLPKLGPRDRARILSLHPLYDGTVPVADTIIPGARKGVIPAIGHALGILVALVFVAPVFIRFLRRQAV
jgi:dienelactone hydrolase